MGNQTSRKCNKKSNNKQDVISWDQTVVSDVISQRLRGRIRGLNAYTFDMPTRNPDHTQYEYDDKTVIKMHTPEYTFAIGDLIDARDINGDWRLSQITGLRAAETNKNIYGLIKVRFVDGRLMNIEVSATNICLCNVFCCKYSPTHVTWANHTVASPNTQSKKWKELRNALSLSSSLNYQICKRTPLDEMHHKLTLFVFGFIRQKYEKVCNKHIPMDIKQIVYVFWEYWSTLAQRDTVTIKNEHGKWKEAVVKSKAAMIANKYIKIEFAFCLSMLRMGQRIDVKDNDDRWYLAEIVATKDAKRRFPMHPPSKKKQLKQNAAIYVRFVGYNERFNEWISLKKGVICNCCEICDGDMNGKDHKIASANTQSDYNVDSIFDHCKTQILCINGDSFCDCADECNNSDHRLKFAETNKRLIALFCFM
eukprot:16620_1